MSNSVCKTSETPIDFCFRLGALGKRYGLSDQAIIKYARLGLQNRELQTAIAPMKFKDLKEFRETITEYLSNQTPNATRAPMQNYNKNKNNKIDEKENSKITIKSAMGTLTCYNCGQEGHISSKCAKPQRRQRCKDCEKVHPRNEPVNCGKKNTNVRQINLEARSPDKKIIQIKNSNLCARIDTGSECDLIKESVANKLGVMKRPCRITITGIGGGKRQLHQCCDANIQIDETNEIFTLYIVDDDVIDTDILLGQPIFNKPHIHIHFTSGESIFKYESTTPITSESITPKTYVLKTSITSENMNNHSRIQTPINDDDIKCGADLNKNQVRELIGEYRDIFSTNLSEIGKTDLVSMKITLTSDKIVNQVPHRIPAKKKEVVSKMINELLENGIIEKSESNYASPVVLHRKKDGNNRLCIDYRRINELTEQEIFPLPNIEEQLHEAKRYRYFTILDLNSGYYQVPVEPNSRKYTAFITTDGLYQFRCMPFGLRNSPAYFLRLMSKLKESTQPGDMIHYMDDILVGGATIDEMLEKLKRVFTGLRKAKLTLNLKKCEFGRQSISFLGHELTPEGIGPGEAKTKAIDDFPIPQGLPEVRRFLGLCGYFRKFVPGFAIKSEPLRVLLRKNQPFIWGDEQNSAFNGLKNALTSKPVMTSYRQEAEHMIHTDASAVGLAAVLLQKENENWKPIAYYSRSTTDNEKKFHSFELETLAVVEGLERFKYYVYGKPITVLSDCQAVKSTMSKRDLVPRIGRWWLRVEEFKPKIEYRPGNRMEHVDALSRSPIAAAYEMEEATLRVDKAVIEQTDWLTSLQLSDIKIQKQISELKSNVKSENDEYLVENDRLFRKVEGRKLWVVPKALRWKIVHECHDNAGHMAVDNTITRIKRTMWFSRMRNFVKSYIKSCIDCAYNKRNQGRIEGEYHCDDVPAVPFKTIHMDHLGPFPKSKSRNEHVLVLVDAFSKFTIIRAVKSTKTKFVINILNEFTSYFGMPDTIVTDRGTSFTSKEFESFCSDNDIKHIKNAVRSPRANGHAERTNRTILEMLLPSTDDDKTWDENLRNIQWVINTLRNKTTHCTPQEIIYSFTPRDILKNKVALALHEHNHITAEELLQLRQNVQERVTTERGKAKVRYDLRHTKPKTYEVGNLVLIEHEPSATGTSRKLEPRWKGPFIITKVLGHDRYVVEDLPDSKRKQKHYNSVYASDKIKMWCPIPDDDDSEGDCDDSEDDCDEDAPLEPDGRAESSL